MRHILTDLVPKQATFMRCDGSSRYVSFIDDVLSLYGDDKINFYSVVAGREQRSITEDYSVVTIHIKNENINFHLMKAKVLSSSMNTGTSIVQYEYFYDPDIDKDHPPIIVIGVTNDSLSFVQKEVDGINNRGKGVVANSEISFGYRIILFHHNFNQVYYPMLRKVFDRIRNDTALSTLFETFGTTVIFGFPRTSLMDILSIYALNEGCNTLVRRGSQEDSETSIRSKGFIADLLSRNPIMTDKFGEEIEI